MRVLDENFRANYESALLFVLEKHNDEQNRWCICTERFFSEIIDLSTVSKDYFI